MRRIIGASFLFFLFFGIYLIEHTQFDVFLENDVDFAYGKSRRKKRGKNLYGFRGFLRMFFYLDIKREVRTWHYVVFWINAISFLPMTVSLIGYAVYEIEYLKNVFYISGMVHYITCFISTFSYWRLYKGNKVRSKRTYRKHK